MELAAIDIVLEEPARLDAALAMPARVLRELCAAGRVRVVAPGQRFGRAVLLGRPRLEAGARVVVLDERADPRVLPEEIPLHVLFDDDVLLVVNKPAGMPTMAGPKHPAGTLANALRGLGGRLSSVEGPLRPGIVHRLDLGTSGAIVIARTDAAHLELAAQLRVRTMHRIYLAIVFGAPSWEATTIESHLGQRRRGRKAQGAVEPGRGKPAITGLRVLVRGETVALVEARPVTGRRHQIRAHLAAAGYPVLGDTLYSGASPAPRRAGRALGLDRPALHALRVELRHPATGADLAVTAPLAADLAAALERAGLRCAP
jgi:23S rRNA pseudouridine1911/1915/1917 synthase